MTPKNVYVCVYIGRGDDFCLHLSCPISLHIDGFIFRECFLSANFFLSLLSLVALAAIND